ncbi:AfsR/SARP family transcriptional regulator [Nocardioides solisilvae]|uniref:AfsR/SARP family transcriptional regulator n=1 Tax=Nocardioides solisilvae TaxID=1542435 RepID=UPI000D74E9B5|nr:BTAD domain-containing putative transcriptional regulator [Nocardioides solisilvae]
MKVEIRLLGSGVVRTPDGEVDPAAWRTAKTFDLLRVLALADGRAVASTQLMDHFWPTAGPAQAAASLRSATCQLRKVLGNEAVVRVGHGLALPDAWVDVAAYRSLAEDVEEVDSLAQPARVVALVREAEALYDDDLDVGATDCPTLHEVGQELRALRVRLLLEGAEAAGRCADWTQSLALARQASALEPSDRATRALMRAWFAVGETAKPVEEFERLRSHLADEYGVDPAPQTRALYLEVVSACREWPPRESTIGREDEVRQVVTAATGWLMDPDGPSGVVWLVGDPGSGRETVAREAARTLMLPVVDAYADPGTGATIELLRDQGRLTKGLAAMLRLRAETWSRIMLVPVSEIADGALGADDAVVLVPPLERPDFRRLMTLTLQGRPTQRLKDELFEESRGLPGLACGLARQRMDLGDLSWVPEGVDSARRAMRNAVAPLVIALLGLFGAPTVVDAEPKPTAAVEEKEERQRRYALV